MKNFKSLQTKLGVLFIVVSSLLSITAAASNVPDQVESDIFKKAETNFGITGSFVQIWADHLNMSKEEWQKALRALHSLGNQTLIIQYSKFNKYSMIPQKSEQTDAIEQILSYADQNGIDVYVGTAFDSRWIVSYNDTKILTELSVINEDLLPVLWNRYGKHKSFVGWYIPFETMDWDFSDLSIFNTDVFNLRYFFQRLVNDCRSVSDRKVKVMAGSYFVGRMTPNYVEYSYTELLKNTGLDIFLVQDGFGVRHWKKTQKQVAPFLEAFKSACDANHIDMWTVAESFEMKETVDHFEKGGLETKMGLAFSPTTLPRLQMQVEADKPYSSKIVQFDGFHYMNPARGEDRAKLYDDVRSLILGQ